ncbi:hypothetical protein, partial [Anaerotignum lactatifermentans]|uniref:hypothetical protein n=1 Tax=Anaerotignum lactatifermentans TaxID=160404 RepID=UPI00194EC5A2
RSSYDLNFTIEEPLQLHIYRKSFTLPLFLSKEGLPKQLPLKQPLIFLFLDFLRGIATAVFIRKHNK